MKKKHFIDSHKGVTGIAILIMMAVFDQWHNPTARVYFAIHGTYGMLWVLKSRIFPDTSWAQPIGLVYAIYIWIGLTLYWASPLIITSQNVEAPLWLLAVCIIMYSLGVFLHFASDMQKHTALKLKPGLITDGMWSYIRNPNYLGELLIYLAFALLAMHWIPLVVLALFIVIIWLPNMREKDEILSQFPEFEEYKARTKKLIPLLF